MRNLKKVLSMALALVMMLGMLTIGASAADEKKTLADFDSVENKEAVSLLVDLGIIAGIETNGVLNYKPEDGIDRNSFAKLVYFILMGDESADNYKGAGTLKDVSGNWAEGFINYLNSVKIVAGDEKGYFNGSQKVTVAQAAKMLLVTLGYDAVDRGYEGDVNWSINIMKDALSKGLMNDVGQTAAQELTRDNAAQMVYNTLFATTVSPEYGRDSGEKYVLRYLENPTTKGLEVYGLVKVTASLAGIADGITVTGVTPAATANTIAAKAAAEEAYSFGPESVGGSVVFYAKAGYNVDNGKIASYTFKDLYSSKVFVGSVDILGSTFGNVTLANLTTKGKSGYVAPLATGWTAYENGIEMSYTLAELTTAVETRGVIVDLIDNGDGEIGTIRLTKKTVGKLSSDVTTRVSNDEDQIRVQGLGAGLSNNWQDAANFVGAEGLKKDDVVLFVTIGGVTYVEKAASVNGEKTANTSGGSIVFAGSTYYMSALAGKFVTNIQLDAEIDFNNTYDLYLDNGKNIVKADQVTDDTSSNYAFVLDSAWVAGSGIGASNYAQAQLLFTDGTVEVVTVSKIAGVSATSANCDDLDGQFVNFGISSDKYQLTATTEANIELTAGTVTNGKSAVTGNGTITANANTVFIVASENSDGDIEYNTYTGIANVPTITNITGVVIKDGSFAKFVVITLGDAQGDTGEFVYFADDAYSVDKDGIRTYAGLYVNGEEADIRVEVSTDTAFVTGSSAEPFGMLVKVSGKNASGVITKFDTVDLLATSTQKDITAVGGGIITIGDDTLSYDTDTVVYVVTADGEFYEGSASDLALTEKEASVYVPGSFRAANVEKDNGYLVSVYIVEIPEPPAAG